MAWSAADPDNRAGADRLTTVLGDDPVHGTAGDPLVDPGPIQVLRKRIMLFHCPGWWSVHLLIKIGEGGAITPQAEPARYE